MASNSEVSVLQAVKETLVKQLKEREEIISKLRCEIRSKQINKQYGVTRCEHGLSGGGEVDCTEKEVRSIVDDIKKTDEEIVKLTSELVNMELASHRDSDITSSSGIGSCRDSEVSFSDAIQNSEPHDMTHSEALLMENQGAATMTSRRRNAEHVRQGSEHDDRTNVKTIKDSTDL